MLTYVVGDIHGELAKLRKALGWIHDDARETSHRVIFLGDYIDRGPDSRGVVELLMAGPSSSFAEWITLKGNHEELMLGSFGDPEGRTPYVEVWLNNGGMSTFDQFLTKREDPLLGSVDALDRAVLLPVLDWLKTLPLTYEDEHRIYCHSGVLDPEVPLDRQDPQLVLWLRPRPGPTGFGKLIVHGHTPHSLMPAVRSGRLNLDTGSCFGGPLTVARFDGPDMSIHRFWGDANAAAA